MTHLQDAAASDAALAGVGVPERLPLPRPRMPFGQWRPAILAGRGNRVEGPGLGGLAVRLLTAFWGASSDNLVRVGRNFGTGGLAIHVAGAGNRVEIGDDVRFSGEIKVRGFGLTVRIGDRCDVKRTHILACEAGVEIGRDCLVAADVQLRASDMHRMVDRASGQPVNPARPIVVGDNVWLCAEAVLLKGARVPDGCVVGLRSVVTRGFDEPDCVLAGSPARVVRRGIAWSR